MRGGGLLDEEAVDIVVEHAADFPADVVDVDGVRDFDIDVALADDRLFAAAENLRIPLRSGGSRTARLNRCQVDALGLGDLVDDLAGIAGREVNFMIFREIEDARARGFNIVIPR